MANFIAQTDDRQTVHFYWNGKEREMVAFGGAELILVMLMYSGMGIPFGVPPTAEDPVLYKIAPDDCIFFTTWAGMATPDASSGNHTEQLMAEPEVQELIKVLRIKFKEGFAKMRSETNDPGQKLMAEMVPTWAPFLVSRPSAIFISDVQVTRQGPQDASGAIVVNIGKYGKQVSTALMKLEAQLLRNQFEKKTIAGTEFHAIKPTPDAPLITWGVKGKYLMLAVGEDTIPEILERAKTDVPKWLTELRSNMPVERTSTVSYLNVAKVLEMVNGLADPPVPQILQALEFNRIRSIVSVTGLDETGFVNRSKLVVAGELPNLFSPMTNHPITAEQLWPIPKDANVAGAMSIDLTQFLDVVVETLSRIEPNAAASVQMGVDQASAMLGADVKKDLLKSLGNVWTIHNSPSEGGVFFTGITLTVELKDAAKFKQIAKRLILMAKNELPEEGPRIAISKFKNTTIFRLVDLPDDIPLAPAWCITDSHFVVSLHGQNIKSMLVRGEGYQSIAKHEKVAGLLESTQVNGLSYVDNKQIAQMVYPILPYVLQVASRELRRTGVDLDPTILPSLATLSKHLRSSVTVLSSGDQGIEIRTEQTLPGGNVVAAAPVSVAVLLPAVSAARQAARRSSSINQLRQLGIALANYESAMATYPAAATKTKAGKPGLSWRVKMLPYLEDVALYEEFKLDEPWDSPHNKALISRMPSVFRSPNSNAGPGMTNYLAVRGNDSIIAEGVENKIRNVVDGTSKTVVIVEADDANAVIWTKPDDYKWDANDPAKGLGLNPGFFLAAFADAHIRPISKFADAELIKAVFTKSGGEAIDLQALAP